MKADARKRVLFVCTGNSCRSQMAEGWCRQMHSDSVDVCSAGLEAQGVNPLALKVMAEAGVDISAQQSNSLEQFADQSFDLVITVCDHADDHCPGFVGSRIIHQSFQDPPRLAAKLSSETDQLDCYRRVRDQIRDWIGGLDQFLNLPIATEGKPTC